MRPQKTYPQISGIFYKLVMEQGSDSIAQQKAVFVPSSSNPFPTQQPATVSYKLTASPLSQKLCSSSAHHLLFNQQSLMHSFTQHAARLKDFTSPGRSCLETGTIQSNMFFKRYFQVQLLSNSLSFLREKLTCLHLCPVLTAICQGSIFVQNNRSTVKQGFYPTLIRK